MVFPPVIRLKTFALSRRGSFSCLLEVYVVRERKPVLSGLVVLCDSEFEESTLDRFPLESVSQIQTKEVEKERTKMR